MLWGTWEMIFGEHEAGEAAWTVKVVFPRTPQLVIVCRSRGFPLFTSLEPSGWQG